MSTRSEIREAVAANDEACGSVPPSPKVKPTYEVQETGSKKAKKPVEKKTSASSS